MIVKRFSERIDTFISVNYFCKNELYSGIITNLSDDDMYIKTTSCFPRNSTFDILMPEPKGIFVTHVTISRIHKEDDKFVGMGLKIMEQTEKYLEFVQTLK